MYINTGNGIHCHIVRISLYCLEERTLAIIVFPAYKTEFTDLMCITTFVLVNRCTPVARGGSRGSYEPPFEN